MFAIVCCLVVGLGLGLDLVSGWLVIMHTYVYYFRLSLSHTSDSTRPGSSRFRRCKYYQSTEPTLDGIKCEIYYLVSVYTKCVNITETGRKTGVRCGSASKYSLGTAE